MEYDVIHIGGQLNEIEIDSENENQPNNFTLVVSDEDH